MKKHKLPKDSFIGGYYINKKLCDYFITSFNNQRDRAGPGKINSKIGPREVDKNRKDSLDLEVPCDLFTGIVGEYRLELQKCLNEYIKTYPQLNDLARFNVKNNFNIQYYKPGGGFKKWHNERTNLNATNRILVFMTYLNDVDDGGTEFKYQKIITPAKKGLTLIWPTDWPFTHRGQISKTKEKYIITGWFNYY